MNSQDSGGAQRVSGRAGGVRREIRSQHHRPLQWGLPADGSRPRPGKQRSLTGQELVITTGPEVGDEVGQCFVLPKNV